MTDQDLIRRIQAGNIGDYEELINRYQARLQFFCERIVRDPSDAADAVQETFIKVYKNIDKIDPERKLSTYLFEIAKNQAISLWRKKHRQVPLPEELSLESKEVDDQSGLHTAIDRLESKYSRVLKLYYFEELSYAQIAKNLQLPINTVRTYLFRAKAQLKKLISR